MDLSHIKQFWESKKVKGGQSPSSSIFAVTLYVYEFW